jgi:hypothetical protein
MCEEANAIAESTAMPVANERPFRLVQISDQLIFFFAKGPHLFTSHATITEQAGGWRFNDEQRTWDNSGVRHTGTDGILTGMKGKGYLTGSQCVSIATRQ